MGNVTSFSSKQDIHAQACAWVSKLDRGLSQQEQIELQQWVAINEHHKTMLFEMAALWDDLSVMHELSGLFPLQDKTNANSGINNKPSWHRHPIAIAASFVLFCTMAIAWLVPMQTDRLEISTQHTVQQVQRESTQVGEQKTVSLADGSVLHLNTSTALEISYSEGRRDIRLLQGEAHFEVAHDQTRPFVVSAGSSQVTAVGTAFNVELVDNGALELLVTEGKVMVQDAQAAAVPALDQNTTASFDTVFMVSGEAATFNAEGQLNKRTLSLDKVQKALSWQQGILVFEGEPLKEALVEVSRYTDIDFALDDPSLETVRVAGFFKVGDIDGLLHALDSNFEIAHQKVSQDSILLMPK